MVLCALDFSTTPKKNILVQINQFRETETMCKGKKIRIHTVQSTITKLFTPRN